MFDLVQPNRFEAVQKSIAEAAHRLLPRYRADYVVAALRREIRSARSLKHKTYQAQVERQGWIVWLLESFGVEDASRAGYMIAGAAHNLTVSDLEQLLLSFSYGSARQAIQATTQLGTLQTALQCYLDAGKDFMRAHELYWCLRDLQRAVEQFIAIRRALIPVSQVRKI
jgi:hypothetical protein